MAKEEEDDLSGFEIATRHIVMEKDLNAFGNLFGGAVLSWLDEGAALYVMEKIGYANFVTVKMDDVSFLAPGRRGDALALYCKILRIRKSSITIQERIFAHEPITGNKREIINCKITFACLKDNKPYAYFKSEDYKKWIERKKNYGKRANDHSLI